MFKGWFLVGLVFLVSLVVVGCGIPQEDYDAMVAQRDAAGAEVVSLQSDLARVQTDLVDTENDLARLQSDLADTRNDLARARSLLESAETLLLTEQGEYAALQSQISSLQRDIAEVEMLTDKWERLTERLSGVETKTAFNELVHVMEFLSECVRYSNDEYGFSIRYPDNWEEVAPETKATVFRASAGVGVPGFVILVVDETEGDTFVEVLPTALESRWVEIISEGETTLADGTSAFWAVVRFDWQGYTIDAYSLGVKHGGKWIITIVYTTENISAFDENLFLEIAHTLRLY